MLDRFLYAVIAGFVSGIFLRSFVDFGAGFAVFFIFLGGILFLCLFLFNHPFPSSPSEPLRLEDSALPPSPTTPQSPPRAGGEGEKRNTSIILVAVFFLAAGLGMLRYDFADRSGLQRALNPYLGQTVVLEGLVVDEPDERESVVRLIVSVQSLSVQGRTLGSEKGSTLKAKILITTNREPKYAYGDRMRVEGKLERPRNFKDATTLREVDYISHLAKDGIHYEMFKPRITLLARGEGNPIVEKLFTFKRAFITNVNRFIPQPHAALLAGLVVGAKQSLGKKLLDDFRTVGVIHIVVLSGYNITIIARFIEWLFSSLRRNARLIIAALAMILFALMVGASATVVRATIMALLVLLAHGTGRLYAVTRALLVAGVIMLLHNPKILVFDISFQLSFLATVGLIYFSPLIEPRVKWVTERWWLREIVVATIATQLFVLPFLLYKMGTLSLVSLPVNLLVLIAIPATMLFGFITGLAGFVWHALALPFAYGAYALLAYELVVVDWFAKLPFASVALASFPLWLVLGWYGLYGLVIWKLQPKNSFR